ncbi:50S ribosomal protein L35ae, partial [archaeon]|nr:50S ribosomal protein L35ae [archaeon]
NSIKEKSKAAVLLGRKLYWQSGAGKKVYGKITAVHGGNGAVRAKFTKGLPGTALGEKVQLVE